VVFDDPGKYRQIITADQTFGYISFSVKMKKTDMFPNEVYNLKSAAVLAAKTEPVGDAAAALSGMSAAAVADTPEPVKIHGLTVKQLAIAGTLFVGVFAVMFMALLQFAR